MRGIIRTAAASMLILGLGGPASAADCRSGVFEVAGLVADANGRGVADARVYLLLDRISQKKFAVEGVRARGTRTDPAGRFRRSIVCGESPDPCSGSRPKFLTMIVEAGDRTSLRQFKIKDLDVVEGASACEVRVPVWEASTRK